VYISVCRVDGFSVAGSRDLALTFPHQHVSFHGAAWPESNATCVSCVHELQVALAAEIRSKITAAKPTFESSAVTAALPRSLHKIR
jgi:hypothetical protein